MFFVFIKLRVSSENRSFFIRSLNLINCVFVLEAFFSFKSPGRPQRRQQQQQHHWAVGIIISFWFYSCPMSFLYSLLLLLVSCELPYPQMFLLMSYAFFLIPYYFYLCLMGFLYSLLLLLMSFEFSLFPTTFIDVLWVFFIP